MIDPTETTAELTCRELVELVTDYLEGALPPLEQQRFEAHLAECSGCRDYLEQVRRTVALVGRLHEDQLTPSDRNRLLNLFRGWRSM